MKVFKIVLQFVSMFCFSFSEINAQLLFESDVIYGGVTGGGFSTNTGFGIIETEVFVPIGSTIKKAYLLASCDGQAPDLTVSLNGDSYIFDDSHIVTPPFVSGIHPSWTWSNSTIRAIDVLNSITPNSYTHTLNIPPQFNITLNGFYSSFYLFIVFENPSLNPIAYNVFLNTQNVNPFLQYNLSTSSPISISADVGLGVWTTFFGDTLVDGSYISLNGISLGLLGGSEPNSPFTYTGVYANFSYFNATLTGLEDDIPNNTMAGTDALAEISDYIINNDSSVEIQFSYQSPNNIEGAYSNPVIGFFLTYTSPCQPFNADLLTSDTTTCAFVPVQLGASGGNTSGAFQAYEWLPQQNLSCYDCPNPVFLGDSTINYTVRIWASDSCSKVLPVRVRVLPNPSFESIEITESVCGGATGSIAVASSGLSQPHTFQINNGTPQNNGTFNNLAAGAATVTVSNADGCSVDSTIVIGEFNNVVAAFSVNPLTGAAPLDISITNQSQNATEYFWDFTDEDGNLLNQVTGHFGSAQCPVAGVYTLTLVAGNGAPHCNDTSSVLIVVKEPFVVFAYTHVTNEANLYQVFFSGVSEYDYKIYALDGKLVYQKSGSVAAAGHVDLWEISKFSSGMYVFRIKVKDLDGEEHEVDGKVVVVR